MVGVADRFGVSGKPWELVQHFGLTAEHIADRVLALYKRKEAMATRRPEPSSVLAAIECARCHTLVPFGEFLGETPLPGDELCGDCERRSPENCSECRTEWIISNANFRYLCRDCREITAAC